MNLSRKQMEAIGVFAGQFRPDMPIDLQETNLHGGKTIALVGQCSGGRQELVIVIMANGKGTEL